MMDASRLIARGTRLAFISRCPSPDKTLAFCPFTGKQCRAPFDDPTLFHAKLKSLEYTRDSGPSFVWYGCSLQTNCFVRIDSDCNEIPMLTCCSMDADSSDTYGASAIVKEENGTARLQLDFYDSAGRDFSGALYVSQFHTVEATIPIGDIHYRADSAEVWRTVSVISARGAATAKIPEMAQGSVAIACCFGMAVILVEPVKLPVPVLYAPYHTSCHATSVGANPFLYDKVRALSTEECQSAPQLARAAYTDEGLLPGVIGTGTVLHLGSQQTRFVATGFAVCPGYAGTKPPTDKAAPLCVRIDRVAARHGEPATDAVFVHFAPDEEAELAPKRARIGDQ